MGKILRGLMRPLLQRPIATAAGYTPVTGGGVNTAAKIIAAQAARGGLPTVMSSPAIITKGVEGAASTINGAVWNLPSILLTDARIRPTGPLAPARPGDDTPTSKLGFFPAWVSKSGGVYDGGNGWEESFDVTGLTAFDISCSAFGATGVFSMRIFVDDQVVTSIDTQVSPGSFTGTYYKVQLAGGGDRRIRLALSGDATIVGINVNAGAVVSAPAIPADEVKMIALGDSFDAMNSLVVSNSLGTWAKRFALLMGARMIPMGRPGQGYVLPVDGRTINQRVPLDFPRVDVPDLVTAHPSVNDFQQNTAAIQIAAADMVTQVRAKAPNAVIFVPVAFNSTNANLDAARLLAFYNGAMSVADGNTIVLDATALPLELAATSGNMTNGVAHDSPEGVHWGPNEIAYNVDLLFKALMSRLKKTFTVFGAPSPATRSIAYSWTPSSLYASGAVAYVLSGASLPSGLNFNTATGAITGTPTTAGSTTGLVITATDNAGSVSSIGPVTMTVAAGAPLTAFDTVGAGPGVAFLENNRRITTTVTNTGAKCTSSRNAGTQYSEFTLIAVSGYMLIGLMNSSGTLNNWANTASFVGLDNEGNVANNFGTLGASGLGSLASGNVINQEFERTNNRVRWAKNGGAWSAWFTAWPTGAMFLCAQPGVGSVRISTELSQFSYPGLAGSNAWN